MAINVFSQNVCIDNQPEGINVNSVTEGYVACMYQSVLA